MNVTGRAGPRFSILLPTHNRADVLPFAVRSALAQTERQFELLIAGDGCTDTTRDVVASFRDPRIRWLDLPKAPGIGYATRNTALREARGELVAYLAHDDIWFPDHLERLGGLLERTGAEMVHSRLLGVDVGGEIRPFACNLELPSHREGLSRGQLAVSISCVAHTMRCLEKYGDWNETMLRGGDVDLWHRIASGAPGNIAFLAEPTALHFVANWRATGPRVKQRQRALGLADGLLDDAVPPALQLEIRPGETAQQAAWREIAGTPDRVRAMRHGAVQYHDAQLWKVRTTAGLLGFRAGAKLGGWFDRLRYGTLWLTSKEWRQWRRDWRQRAHAHAAASQPAGAGPRTIGGKVEGRMR